MSRFFAAALYGRWALPLRFKRWVRLNSLLLKMFRPGFSLSASLMGEGSQAFAADLSALKGQILSRSHLGLNAECAAAHPADERIHFPVAGWESNCDGHLFTKKTAWKSVKTAASPLLAIT